MRFERLCRTWKTIAAYGARLAVGIVLPSLSSRTRTPGDLLERGRKRALPPGYGVEDGVAIHFKAGQRTRVIASGPDRFAFEVELGPNGVVETALPVDELVTD